MCVASEQMSEMYLPPGKYLKLHTKHLQITEKNTLRDTRSENKQVREGTVNQRWEPLPPAG